MIPYPFYAATPPQRYHQALCAVHTMLLLEGQVRDPEVVASLLREIRMIVEEVLEEPANDWEV